MNSNVDEIVASLVEVSLPNPDNFLKIMETLTRIGIANKNNQLYQSCHILQKKGRFYIVHFKELFLLDGKEANFSDEDKGRRNKIASLLQEWDLVKLVNPQAVADPQVPLAKIKVLPFKEKDQWELLSKYKIGKKKKENAA